MTRLPDYVKGKNLNNSRMQEDAASDIEAALAKARKVEDVNA
jgi:hypothetical protein